ncbi:hypothetical protein [[Eubacterium] cellulosolvens]
MSPNISKSSFLSAPYRDSNEVISSSTDKKLRSSINSHRLKFDKTNQAFKHKTIIKSKALTDNHGLINGNGLTDGNGLTINLFSNNDMNNQKVHRKLRLAQIAARNKRKKLLQSMIVTILILLPLSIYFFDLYTEHQLIKIDGEFSDWDSDEVTVFLDSETEQVTELYTNLVECRAFSHDEILEFYIQTELDMFGKKDTLSNSEINPEVNPKVYKLNIFIDHDLDSTSGYQIQGLGADERIELQGQNGMITHSDSYYFDICKSNLDWNGWIKNSEVIVSKDKLRLEGRHYLTKYSLPNPEDSISNVGSMASESLAGKHNIWQSSGNPNQVGILVQMMDNENHYDLMEPFLTSSEQWHNLVFTDLSPDNILSTDDDVPLLGLEFTPHYQHGPKEPQPLELYKLTWAGDYSQLQDFGNLKLFIDKNTNRKIDVNDHEITYCEPVISQEGELTLEFSKSLLVPCDKITNYLVVFDPSQAFDTNEPKLVRFGVGPQYVSASEPIITSVASSSNRDLAVYLGQIPDKITMDGIFADWHLSDQLKTDVDLPILSDFDRDRDINKVGIDIDLESGALSCYLNVLGDLLAGASIPPIFYSDVLTVSSSNKPLKPAKQASVNNDLKKNDKVEMVSQLPEEILCTDTISVFIDTDQNPDTGYSPAWLALGAEYRLEITGRDRLINNHVLLEYQDFSGSAWSWEKIGEVPAYNDHAQLETQVDWLALGLSLHDNLDISFFIFDWMGEKVDSTTLSLTSSPSNNDQDPVITNSFPGFLKDFDLSEQLGDMEDIEEKQMPVPSTTRGTTVETTSASDTVIQTPNQRKLVRDSEGYWYAFWYDNNKVMAKRSSNKDGTDWSTTVATLAGGTSSVIQGADENATYPSAAIFRSPDIENNTIHLVWTRSLGNQHTLCYSKCINITDNQNFTNSNNWRNATGVVGFDIIDDNINYTNIVNKGYASIAIDRHNQPHVVWQYGHAIVKYRIRYSMANSTYGWHNNSGQPLQLTPPGNYDHRKPCIDVGFDGTVHVAYINYTLNPNGINYRTCWNPDHYMNATYWGDASGTSGNEDLVIFNSSDINEPSLICDIDGQVWIVASESTPAWNILYDMEDFGDATYWPGPFHIATSGKLKNATIAYDASGTIYCVWEREIGGGENRICMAVNTSSSNQWSAPTEAVTGNLNMFPQLPKNITVDVCNISFIYKDHTSDELVFHSIPEFHDFIQVSVLMFIITILIMINPRRTRLGLRLKS